MPRAPDPREPLIVASFELAAERSEDLTPDVYARLFREQPEMEILFWRDTNHQIRGEMLTRVPEVFRTFFRTVRDAVREVCAADWTAEWEAAWESLLADLDYYVTHPDQAETQALA